jgi:hypothetical protein
MISITEAPERISWKWDGKAGAWSLDGTDLCRE